MQPSLAAVVRRLADLTGNSQSAIIAELLSESLPVLTRMAEVLQAAARIKDEQRAIPKRIAEGLEETQSRIEAQLGLLLGDMDESFRPMLDAAERIGRRRRASTAAAPDPAPVSNRGVTPSAKRPAKAKQTRLRRHGQV